MIHALGHNVSWIVSNSVTNLMAVTTFEMIGNTFHDVVMERKKNSRNKQ